MADTDANPYEPAPDTQEAQDELYQDDKTPLDDQEVEEAKVIIAKNHPLANTPIHQVFPTAGGCISCCLCCVNKERRKERMAELRKLIKDEKKELDDRMDKVFADHGIVFEGEAKSKKHFNIPSEEEEDHPDYDPYGQLGYGFEAYFDTMNIFGWVFLLMSLLFLPSYCYAAAYGGLKESSHGYYNSIFMLGNFGFNRQVCVSDYVQLDAPRALGCEIGLMTELKYVGLIPNNSNYKSSDMPYGYCADPSYELNPQAPADETLAYCSSTYLTKSSQPDVYGTYLNETFSNDCAGKKECNFTMTKYVDYNIDDPAQRYIHNGTNACLTNPAKVYMQYYCTQTRGQLNSKREQGLFISCCAAFAAVLFLVVVWYLQKTNKLDFEKWDIDNLTCSDFTIEYAISQSMWDQFVSELHVHNQTVLGGAAPDHQNQGLPVVTMEAFLEHQLTRRLNKCRPIMEDVEIRIANITFAFANEELLGLLKKRGGYVASGKLHKVPELNAKIDELCKKNKAEYTRPVTAFVTFERQEGKDRCLKYFCDPKTTKQIEVVDAIQNPGQVSEEQRVLEEVEKVLLRENIYCYSASEPSDILWENRHVTWKRRKINQMIVCCLSIIFLIVMFFLFVWMKSLAVANMFRYPATTNCESIQSIFAVPANQNLWPEYAQIDQPYTEYRQGTGIYQCYCKNVTANYAALAASGLSSNDLCHTYFVQFGGGYFLSEAITVVITVVNMIIAIIVKIMIKEVGYWTLTAEISAIMVATFIMTFFNTAILLLLADANTSNVTLLSWVPAIQNGPFTDLTEEWYIVIAPSLILTMVLNACSPLFSIAGALVGGAISKSLDQGCSTYCCCKPEKTTKCCTIQEYVNLYGGPDHLMAPKYSALLNTICVCMMYALAIPELLWVAALTFCIYYLCDRFLITYYYKRPPMYDDKLNATALEVMKLGPIIMCFFGYWCMGNMQIFNSKLIPIQNQSVPFSTEHSMWPSGDQSLPLFIVGLCILLGWIFTDIFAKLLTKMKIMEETPEFVVDEKLGTYFECLSVWDRKSWLAQEVHSTQKLGINTMGAWTREQLRTSQTHPTKVIKSAPNYEVICNPEYVDKFQFTPIERCDTPEEQAVSDTIMKVMYLGYTREGFQEFDMKTAHKKRANKIRKALNE